MEIRDEDFLSCVCCIKTGQAKVFVEDILEWTLALRMNTDKQQLIENAGVTAFLSFSSVQTLGIKNYFGTKIFSSTLYCPSVNSIVFLAL